MNNTIKTLRDGSDFAAVYYAVMVEGRPVSMNFSERFAAEQFKLTLPAEQQKLAEVLPVDANGRQLLLG
jgi:hypothetical protein